MRWVERKSWTMGETMLGITGVLLVVLPPAAWATGMAWEPPSQGILNTLAMVMFLVITFLAIGIGGLALAMNMCSRMRIKTSTAGEGKGNRDNAMSQEE